MSRIDILGANIPASIDVDRKTASDAIRCIAAENLTVSEFRYPRNYEVLTRSAAITII